MSQAPKQRRARRRVVRTAGALVAVGLVAAVAAGATATATTAVPTLTLSHGEPCRAQACRATVTHYGDLATSIQVEVDWSARAGEFTADKTFRCTAPSTPDSIYTIVTPAPCRATSPVYRTSGYTHVAVRVTTADGTQATRRYGLLVRSGPRTRPGRPAPAPGARCHPVKAGEHCGPGNSRTTAGGAGTGKVSHAGWPAITGVFWIVQSAGRGRHTYTGGSRNDELLGHHGDDTVYGGPGRDVLWGDWDPAHNNTRQRDKLVGGAGNDWIYPSHGLNTIVAGPGDDTIIAYPGHGTIDCGPGHDRAQVRLGGAYRLRGCETVTNFCGFGQKPGGGCYKPGEKPAARRRR